MARRRTLLLALAVALPVASVAMPSLSWRATTMGTDYSVTIAGVAPNVRLETELRAAVEQRLEEINRQMSHYRPDSELSRFNRSVQTTPVKVSPKLAHVTRRALELARDSDGAFDPTLEPLLRLWGFGSETNIVGVPTDEQIAVALRQCGARHLRVTAADELQKDIPGLQFNLSAIAKGYAADEVARLLCGLGYSNLLVAVSGEMVALGRNPQGRPWQVGIEQPRYTRWRNLQLCAVVPLSGRAISTSGDSHQFFRDETGRIRGHILDPRTGRPVEHRLASVTVVAPDALTADGAATTLFVLGVERGLHWLEERPTLGALFIVRESDGSFRLIPSPRFPSYAQHSPARKTD